MEESDNFAAVRLKHIAKVPAKKTAGTCNHHFLHYSVLPV